LDRSSGRNSDADAAIDVKYYDRNASSDEARTLEDAAGKTIDARRDEARENGTTTTTTNASTTTTSSTPRQAPGVHESQAPYICQLSRCVTCR
jgi:phage host-nuclease inhibitor protein Gam